MSYSTIDMAPVAPKTQGPSVFGAVVGTVASAMIGAVVMSAVSSVQAPAQQLYAPAMTQVRPVVPQVAPCCPGRRRSLRQCPPVRFRPGGYLL